jgi:hypothetical protein
MALTEIQILLDIDRKIGALGHQFETHRLEVVRRLVALEEQAAAHKELRFRWADAKQMIDTIWFRVVILGLLLAGNVSLLEAVKIALK